MEDGTLPQPRDAMQHTWATYGVLVAVLVLGKVVFLVVPTTFPGADQATAFSWPIILGVSAAGAIGVLLTRSARFPPAWDPTISNRQRIAVPAIAGVVYGVITVWGDLRNPADIHLAFPLSIPFYTFGAVLLEIMLRVFGVTTFTALLWVVLFRRRVQNVAFWIANFLAALYEPWPIMKEELATAPPTQVPIIIAGWLIQPLLLANLLTGYLYRRSGMVSAVVLRLSFYAIWHIAYGGLLRRTF